MWIVYLRFDENIETVDADLESVSLSTNPQFLELIERSCQRHHREGGISLLEMCRHLEVKEKGKQ